MTNTNLKTQIDNDITIKTASKSVTPVNVGNNIKAVVDYIDQEKRPYRSYIALLTQTGTNDPTAVVLENSIGVVSITRFSPGQYYCNLVDFITNKTFFSLTENSGNQSLIYMPNSGTIAIFTYMSNVNADNVLLNTPIEIRIYN